MAGEHPYAWATSLGLPKALVTAVQRGDDDYRPIRRTVANLAVATGRSEHWWLTGEDEGQGTQQSSGEPTAASAPAGAITSSGRADPQLLALAIQAFEEFAAARKLGIAPERKAAVISLLYDYLARGAEEKDVEAFLKIVG